MTLSRLLAAVMALLSVQNVGIGLVLVLEGDVAVALVFFGLGFGIGFPALDIALGEGARPQRWSARAVPDGKASSERGA